MQIHKMWCDHEWRQNNSRRGWDFEKRRNFSMSPYNKYDKEKKEKEVKIIKKISLQVKDLNNLMNRLENIIFFFNILKVYRIF